MSIKQEIDVKKEIALQIVKQDGRKYSILQSELKNDRDVFLTAIKNGYKPSECAEEVPEKFLIYKSVVMMMLKSEKNIDFIIKNAPEIMLYDRDIAILLMASVEDPFKYYSLLPKQFHNVQFVEDVLEYMPSLAYEMCKAPLEVQMLIMPDEWIVKLHQIYQN